jgi:hypothetical protein
MDRIENLAAPLSLLQQPVGMGPLSRDKLRSRLWPRQNLIPLSPHARPATVNGNPVKPGFKTRTLANLKARQRTASADKRFLRHVFGVLLVAHNKAAEAEDIILETPDQRLDCQIISSLAAADQCFGIYTSHLHARW